MKSELSVPREHLIQKNRARYYSNHRIALQLYSIYKAEAITKKSPRIPSNDPRKLVLSSKRRVVLASYVKQQVTACMSSIRASGIGLNHSIASLFRN